MLELNGWFFVLVVNFLVLIYVLNAILYKPLLRIFSEREKAHVGTLKEAEEMQRERDRLLAEMKAEYVVAAIEAKGRFEALRKEGLDAQQQMLADASVKVAGILDEARAELRKEADKTRAALKERTEAYADEIVEKLVGA